MDYEEYRKIVHTSNDIAEIDRALADALRTLAQAPHASPTAAAEMRGERANWLLRRRQYDEAIAEYIAVEREFRSAHQTDGTVTAMAGRGRALSRDGKYQESVAVFEAALKETGAADQQTNLLVGLGSAHLREATEQRDPADAALIAKAIAAYRQVIARSELHDPNRANARLGLARALGEHGEQAAAMDEFDRAIAELAHLGSPTAKLLIEKRDVFVRGGWRSIGLS